MQARNAYVCMISETWRVDQKIEEKVVQVGTHGWRFVGFGCALPSERSPLRRRACSSSRRIRRNFKSFFGPNGDAESAQAQKRFNSAFVKNFSTSQAAQRSALEAETEKTAVTTRAAKNVTSDHSSSTTQRTMMTRKTRTQRTMMTRKMTAEKKTTMTAMMTAMGSMSLTGLESSAEEKTPAHGANASTPSKSRSDFTHPPRQTSTTQPNPSILTHSNTTRTRTPHF